LTSLFNVRLKHDTSKRKFSTYFLFFSSFFSVPPPGCLVLLQQLEQRVDSGSLVAGHFVAVAVAAVDEHLARQLQLRQSSGRSVLLRQSLYFCTSKKASELLPGDRGEVVVGAPRATPQNQMRVCVASSGCL
jgi:hypothetical protein